MADETQQLVKREPRALEKAGFAFLPKTWEELFAYAKEISQTDFVPKTLQGKPGAVLAAWQTGQEVGLPPMAALQSIAIINGRPSIHSNGYWALVTSHPLCEWFKETSPDDALKQGYGECTIKRHGNPHVITRRFSIEEAKTAGLIGKDNWKNYPGDMLQNRARHRAGDDAIPEACLGLLPSDVARDLPPEPRDVTPIQTPQPLREVKADEKAATDEQLGRVEPSNNDASGVARQAENKVATRRVRNPVAEKSETVSPLGEVAPKSQEEIIAECLLWVENAPEDQLLQEKDNWLLLQLPRLKGTQNQMAVLRPFNDRRHGLNK